MSIGSYFLARAARLPKARFRVSRTRNIRVKMRDGVELETELYVPRNGVRSPTILMRVPYGIQGFSVVAELYAEAKGRPLYLVRQPRKRAASSRPPAEANEFPAA